MPRDYLISSITLPVGATPTRLLTGRPARTCLIISSAVSGTTFVGVREGDFTNNIFARVSSGDTLVMPYRDFGPLITGEIWITTTVNGSTVNGAEVYDVAKGRR